MPWRMFGLLVTQVKAGHEGKVENREKGMCELAAALCGHDHSAERGIAKQPSCRNPVLRHRGYRRTGTVSVCARRCYRHYPGHPAQLRE